MRLKRTNTQLRGDYAGDVVGIVTRLRNERSGARIRARSRGFSLLQNDQTGSVAHPTSHEVGTEVLSWV